MTDLLYGLLIAGLALALAADMHRRQKASGIKTNWTKTVVTGLGSIIVSLCAIGVLVAGLESNHTIAGLILFVIVFAGGLAGLVILVNRRWPMPSPRDSTTSRL